jgi:hypothetical protein
MGWKKIKGASSALPGFLKTSHELIEIDQSVGNSLDKSRAFDATYLS